MKQLIITLLFSSLFIFPELCLAQCDVKKQKLEEGLYRYSMTEKFYEDITPQGLKTIYIHTNFFGDKTDKNNSYSLTIVVTYAWTVHNARMVPNRIKMKLPSNREITLSADKMSVGTLNYLSKAPSSVNTLECVFELSFEDVELLLKEKSISELTIEDYKQNIELDLSSMYKGQIPEMISCIIK